MISLVGFILFIAFEDKIDKVKSESTPSHTISDSKNGDDPNQGNRVAGKHQPKVQQPGKFDPVIDGKKWSLFFEGSALNQDKRNMISLDFGKIMKFRRTPNVFPLMDKVELADGRVLDRRVVFRKGAGIDHKSFNPELMFCLFEGGDETELFIPKVVVSEYERIESIGEKFPQAFQSLDEFLSRMDSIKEKPINNLSNLFLIPEGIESYGNTLINMKPESFSERYGGMEYTTFGRINIEATTGTPFEKFGSLAGGVHAVQNGDTSTFAFVAVYDEHQWRFVTLLPP